MPATSDNRQPWARTTVATAILTDVVIAGIMAAVSYEHEYELARGHGQPAWVSSLLPFTVDGLVLAASVLVVWASGVGIRRPLRPLAALAVGVGATIAANLASGLGDGWLGAVIAAWSGWALIQISDVTMWLTGALRGLATGQSAQPRVNCSCPPPPVTLTEVLPLARARLREMGEPAGEQALADRFQTTRHTVRSALSAAAPADPAVADAPTPPEPATAGHLNGQAPP